MIIHNKERFPISGVFLYNEDVETKGHRGSKRAGDKVVEKIKIKIRMLAACGTGAGNIESAGNKYGRRE